MHLTSMLASTLPLSRPFSSSALRALIAKTSLTMVGGGKLETFVHPSSSNSCDMTFKVFSPAAASSSTPVLYFLSGLTCNTENFATKAPQAFAAANKRNVAIVISDTSPRGDDVPDVPDNYALGQGAGFYVDATHPKYNKHYNMFSYITKELPQIINDNFSFNKKAKGIFGHSMGGHGAIVIALTEGKECFQSVSAFSPITNPLNCDWGKNAFNEYFRDPKEGAAYDATNLLSRFDPLESRVAEILIDQGSEDEFLENQLGHPAFLKSAKASLKTKISYNLRSGYDHSYNFINTFVEDHVNFHADRLSRVVNEDKFANLEPPVAGMENKVIECNAMVARGVDDMKVEQIFVYPPKAGEVSERT